MKQNFVHIGENLTDLGKWAALAVQLIGYFPLTSSTSRSDPNNGTTKTFKFTWTRSILPYYSCLLTAASFTWCLVYFWRYKEFKSFIEFKAPTEVAAYNLMIITSTLSGIYMKIFGLVHGKKYQDFWEKTRSLLDNFHIYFNDDPKTSQDYENGAMASVAGFHKIGTSCKWKFLLTFLPVIGHVTVHFCWPTVSSILDNNSSASVTSTDTQLYLGLGFWTIGALLHVGNAIWMNFFVKIYSECLHSIAIDLRRSKTLCGHHEKNIHSSLPINLYHSQTLNGIGQPANISSDMINTNPSRMNIESRELKKILSRLTCVAHEISRFNDFFGKIILLQVANCVVNLLAFSFFACLWMGRGKWESFGETLVPLYIYGKELLDMGSVAEELSAAADNVLDALTEDVILDNLSEELYLQIQIVSVELCTKPPVISASQFFSINRGLVTSVMSALATFLVVLVQFRDQDDEDAKEAASAKSKSA